MARRRAAVVAPLTLISCTPCCCSERTLANTTRVHQRRHIGMRGSIFHFSYLHRCSVAPLAQEQPTTINDLLAIAHVLQQQQQRAPAVQTSTQQLVRVNVCFALRNTAIQIQQLMQRQLQEEQSQIVQRQLTTVTSSTSMTSQPSSRKFL